MVAPIYDRSRLIAGLGSFSFGLALSISLFNHVLFAVASGWVRYLGMVTLALGLGIAIYRFFFHLAQPQWTGLSAGALRRLALISFGAGVLLMLGLPVRAPVLEHDLAITATGEKNTAAIASEVWVSVIELADGSRIPLAQLSLDEYWEVRDGVPLSYQHQPAVLTWHGQARGDLKIVFVSHPWSGIVTVNWDGIDRQIDLYADANGEYVLDLPARLRNGYPAGSLLTALDFVADSVSISLAVGLGLLWLSRPSAQARRLTESLLPLFGTRTAVLSMGLILFVAFSAVFTTPYAFTDDYTYLRSAMADGLQSAKIFLQAGRPLLGIFVSSAFSSAGNIRGLRLVRVLGLCGLTLLAWLIYAALRRARYPSGVAFCGALAICTLPPFQVAVSWAILFSVPVAAGLAGVAAWLAGTPPRRSGWLAAIQWGGAGVGLLLAASLIYQPAAMFYWVFVAIQLFCVQDSLKTCLQGLVRCCAIAAIGFGLAYAVLQVSRFIVTINTRAALTFDILGKLKWFIMDPLVQALNFYQLQPSPGIAVVGGALMACGLWLYFEGPFSRRLISGAIALFLIPLSYLPNLVIVDNFGVYRTQFGLAALLIIYAILALTGYARFLEADPRIFLLRLAGPLVLIAVVQASSSVNVYFVQPQLAELNYLRARIAETDLRNIDRVHVIRATRQDTLAPYVRRDEFGLPSTSQNWVPVPMAQLVLEEVAPQNTDLSVTSSTAGEIHGLSGHTLFIDMRQIDGVD